MPEIIELKTQEHIILEDLNEFLIEKGIDSRMDRQPLLEVSFNRVIYYFYISHGSIYSPFYDDDERLIVSLADPQYREKFLKFCVALHVENNVLLAKWK